MRSASCHAHVWFRPQHWLVFAAAASGWAWPRPQHWLVFAAAASGWAACAMAQERSAEPAPGDAAAPQRVEVRSERSDVEQRRRESVAKTIYGRDELDKYGDSNVSDVLKRLPGVNITAGNPRLRGLGAGYTLVLINGEPAPPGFSLDNLSPSQVERIEVTKGPTAEHSAQAVAGTINIILREAPPQRQRELRLGLGYTKARPVPSFNATYGDRLGDLSLALPLSGYQWRGGATGQGDRVSRDVDQNLQRLRVQNRDDWWGGGFNFSPRLSWKFNDVDSLNWQSFLQRHQFNSAGRVVIDVRIGQPPASVDDSYDSHGYWQMLRSNLQWVRRSPDGSRIELKAGGQSSRSHYDTDTVGLDSTGRQTLLREARGDNRETTWTGSGKYSRPLFDRHSLALGWDIERRNRRELRSAIDNGQPQLLGFDGQPFAARIERYALWLQDEWELSSQWSTYIGLRSETIQTASLGQSEALSSGSGVMTPQSSRSGVVTPLWHLNYKLDPKGRDLVRASLTRSYKAPELNWLMARPSLNAAYPVDKPNPEIGPDRVGNPGLKPELATGLDIAFEKYLVNGGLISVGMFHRRINGLIRNAVTLESVPWASVPRWVSRPVNLGPARSSGVELELKGRAGELLPMLASPALALNLRASLSWYRSSVDGLPAPHNRLESQQPWSMTLGFDHMAQAMPLTFGASLAYTPGYSVQQTTAQLLDQGRARTIDFYALWTFNRQASLRFTVNNFAPPDAVSRTTLVEAGGELLGSVNRRSNLANASASLTLKF